MMKAKPWILLLALSLSPFAAPLSANPLDELALRQNEMRQDLRALEDRFRRIESQLSSQGLLNLLNQVAELKAEIARLRGQQEEMQNTLAQTQRRLKDVYEDLDNRLRELASRPQPAATAAEAIQLQPSRTLLGSGDGQNETRSYEAALAQFRTGDYAAAVRGFQAFLRDYPNGSLAANALYWLGLAQAAQGNYSAAVESYQRLLSDFPNSNKVPDALLSLARARIQMGETFVAQTLLEQLVARYPQTRAAENARKLLATLK